jgi:hypothetical protein
MSGSLVYRANDYSFDVEPKSGGGFTSLLLNDLNLEMDEEARIVSVWGYCFHGRWKPRYLLPPPFEKGEVRFDASIELVPGVSIRINKDAWPVFVNSPSGWVCIDSGVPPQRTIEVMNGVLVALASDRRLVSLWLKPKALPPLTATAPASS